MTTQYRDLVEILQSIGKDPSRLIFEDELTGINNRRFLLSFFDHEIRWDSGQDFPLSLLMLDLDHFKQVNDTHGHDAGDQVLVWLSSMMREIGGERYFPVRYGGDEFMLLAPGADASEAGRLAELLLERARTQPIRLHGSDEPLPITLSIGVACAPDDASDGDGLIHKADAALYHAKQTGRSRAAHAIQVDLTHVFPKTTLRRLNSSGVVGRDAALETVSKALDAVARHESRWVIFEGAPGMGKSAMLRTVQKNLEADPSFRIVTVTGVEQEGFRPYYLLTNILIALLSASNVDGAEVLAGLTPEETAHLGTLLPQLDSTAGETLDKTEAQRREGIFNTAASLIVRLAGSQPLALLIDDLQFADEPTLHLLRGLMRRKGLTVLVCGSTMETLDRTNGDDGPPLQRFRATYEEALGIQGEKLRPLDRQDITSHLHTVFPGLDAPDTLVTQLFETTLGNPLFLIEVIRKLVLDQKVSPVGQEWAIKPLEDGYLPRSLEEIVTQKIDALDDSGRDLLAHASTLGEDVPVSVLAGAADRSEQDVLQFLDRVEELGLVRQDFRFNDESMQFLGKRVLEICYGQISEGRRQALHERAGAYQETLNENGLGPAASLLAYHFKRSANQTKARQYEQMQASYRDAVFNATEAASYADTDAEEEVVELEERLKPESLPRIPNLLRTVVSAVRAIQLYPAESQAVGDARRYALDAIEAILAESPRLHLTRVDRALLANGHRLDVSEYGHLARSFLDTLEQAELKGVCFETGFTETELAVFVEALSQAKPETIDHGFWSRFSEERRLDHLELEQMRYAAVRSRTAAPVAPPVDPLERGLGDAELAEIPTVLRAFTGAAVNVMLYPEGSNQVAESMEELRTVLQPLFRTHRACSLTVVNRALLANGVRVSTQGFERVANRFIDLLEPVELRSITFESHVTTAELVTLVGALREPPPEIDVAYWRQFAQQHGFSGLSLNAQRYKAGVVETVEVLVGSDGDREGTWTESLEERVQALTDQPSAALRAALPQFGTELLVRDETDLFRRMLGKIYEDFPRLDPGARVETVRACSTLLDSLILALRHRFLTAAVDFLLQVLSEEDHERVLTELAALLHTMSASAIQFADYDLASRVFLALADRRRALELSAGHDTRPAGRVLTRDLDPVVGKTLEEDLVSGDADRQEPAAQVVGSLGTPAIPLLVDIIRRQRPFRTRQMAARLLADLGPLGARQLKRALMHEVTAEHRLLIIEVLDAATRRVTDEVAFCLGDSSAKIRQAAFQLAERIGDPAFVEVVAPHARSHDLDVAQAAIGCLAHLGSEEAAQVLVDALTPPKGADHAKACAQALGQIGKPIAIKALAGLLLKKKRLFFGWRWDDQVRTAAAVALGQIQDPEAEQILARVEADPEPRVRQVARTAADQRCTAS